MASQPKQTTSAPGHIPHRKILGMRVDATTNEGAVQSIVAWGQQAASRYVCFANVHMVMESYDDHTLQAKINAADLVAPDGMPLVWALKALGIAKPERVYGPGMMALALAAAEKHGIPVGFYGGSATVLSQLRDTAQRRHPKLSIAYAWSPPFRALTSKEDADFVEEFNASGARLLFVGLGCPKQERWMAAHKPQIKAVMLGVGAAFDFYTGAKPQAPRQLQVLGLEWLFRLASEPRRLGPRYLKHNPRFIARFCAQLASRDRGQ